MKRSKDFIIEEELQFKKLDDLVKKAIEEEHLLSKKIRDAEHKKEVRFGAWLADRIAAVGGSWSFIIGFLVFMSVWVFLNVMYLRSEAFDPYPFILLNLFLSCLAALQAPIIMMSQNRQEEKDRRRATSDYMVNLKAELEVRSLHSKIDILLSEQMKNLFEIQKKQLDALEEIKLHLKK